MGTESKNPDFSKLIATLEKTTATLLKVDTSILKLAEALTESIHPPSSGPEYLSTAQLAEFLKCKEKNVYLRASKGAENKFPFKTYHAGRRLMFKRAEVESCISKGLV